MSAHKLITAILPTDVDTLRLLERLKVEVGIVAADLHFARGTGRLMRERSAAAEVAQREILTAVVPAERADELFAWIYEAADIGRPHGGIIYLQSLGEATEYTLPDLPEEPGEPAA